MKFEFDPAKSRINEAKHGIGFEEAQKLWKDPNLIDFIVADFIKAEQRWLALGEIDKVLWTVTYTLRAEVTRIISVRRSRKDEKEAYYGYKKEDFGRRV